MKKYTMNTPLENLIASGRFYESEYFNYHLSDVLRFLTLWKYGGIYLDLDVVVVKSIDSLGQNYAVAESNRSLSSSGLNLSPTGVGHQVAENCLEELANNFNGSVWNSNGPALLTRVIRRWCHLNESELLDTFKECSPLKILPANSFLPVHWHHQTYYFKPFRLKWVLAALKDSYAAHIYSHMNSKKKVLKGSRVAYDVLARQHCPRVYETMDRRW